MAQLKQDLAAAQAQNVKLQQDATASTASTDTQAKQQQVRAHPNKLAALICTMQYWQARRQRQCISAQQGSHFSKASMYSSIYSVFLCCMSL